MIDKSAIGGIPLVLGGNVFGWTSKGDEAYAVLDAFFEAGGRMIDTADVYSRFAPGNQGGESETVLGQWIEQRGVRKDVLLHSKTGMMPGDNTYSESGVAEALEQSLERLRTDYLDLYYVHADNEELPVAQIVASFDATTKNGSVRSLGASNFRFERLREAREYADETGAMRFTVLQNHYNLLERDAYGEALQNYCEAHSIAMCPYSGLASGYLTGKYRSVLDLAKSIRGARTKAYLEKGLPVLAVMDEIAKETGASLPAIALAWLRAQPGVAAPIASARNTSQLQALIESTSLRLEEDQLSRLTQSM